MYYYYYYYCVRYAFSSPRNGDGVTKNALSAGEKWQARAYRKHGVGRKFTPFSMGSNKRCEHSVQCTYARVMGLCVERFFRSRFKAVGNGWIIGVPTPPPPRPVKTQGGRGGGEDNRPTGCVSQTYTTISAAFPYIIPRKNWNPPLSHLVRHNREKKRSSDTVLLLYNVISCEDDGDEPFETPSGGLCRKNV